MMNTTATLNNVIEIVDASLVELKQYTNENPKEVRPEYFEIIRNERILKGVCNRYTDRPRSAFGKIIPPCVERCSIETGCEKCKHNWRR